MNNHHRHPRRGPRPPYDPTAPDLDARGWRPRRRRDDFPGSPSDDMGVDPRGQRGGRPGSGAEPGHERGHEHGRGYGYGYGRGPGGRGFGPGFGPGGPRFEGRRGGPGGRRAGRGDIRAAILLLLAEQPMHGYQLIQEILDRSGGQWRPSPGAIYPALNLLEDEGLVTLAAESGRKMASLTPEGVAYVEANAASLGTPWQEAAGRPAHAGRTLRAALEALGGAAAQVARTGTEDQVAQALAVLDTARRDLYLILAGAAPDATSGGSGAPSEPPADDAPKPDTPASDA